MTDVATRLRARLEQLRASGPPPGRAWCRAWTQEVDAALVELHASAPPVRGRLTIAAVGGYGRKELCPGSDVDLLVVVDRVADDDLEQIVRAVVYPLWDAGLQVGYAVRTPAQARGQVKAEVDDATALIDGRTVAGDAALLTSVRDEAIAAMHRRPARLLNGLAEADGGRRARAGDAAEVLEPDLKDGAGGLRDVQSLRWAAAAVVGRPGLDPLVSGRYLGADDRTRLARAYDQLLATRVALHLVTGSKGNVLRLDLQDEVAGLLGFVDGDSDHDTAGHRLLTTHYRAARTAEHVHGRAWRLLSSDATRGRRRLSRAAEQVHDGFEVADGVLRMPDDLKATLDAGVVTRLLAALVSCEAVLDNETAAHLRRATEALGDQPLDWDDEARERFLGVLWQGRPAMPALAELDDVGLVTALLPEWAPLRGRAQRNPFHRYSLDRHAWHAATELARLVETEPWAKQALERAEDRDVVMLGVLLHDVGKAYGEPHAITGMPIATTICERLGLDAAGTARVASMVEQHLFLPDVATRRDVADPALAAWVAEQVGAPEHLAALHLLAAADGLATGPTAWSSWKASLVSTLVTRTAAVLDDRDPERTEEGSVTTQDEALAVAASMGADPDLVADHLRLLPERYAVAVTPRGVVRHALMATKPLEPNEVRTRVTPASDADAAGHDVLDVVAIDRSGLFARVAGVLSLHGGSILQAHAFAREDGVAVDSFTVEPPAEAGSSWWAAVEGDVDEAMSGRLALRARVHRKAGRQVRHLARLPDVATRVTVLEDPTGAATVLEVRTLDRIGVLYEITSAMAELELDIVVAKIQTMGHEAVDAFYVRDHNGEPLDDDHARETALAIEAALHDLAATAESRSTL